MQIIYPHNPLNPKEADEPYQDEYLLLKSKGVKCSLFDFDVLSYDEFKPKPKIELDESVLYRGWMLNTDGYKKLVGFIEKRGGVPVTSLENYVHCHYLPGWYEQCKMYTPETYFFPNNGKLKDSVSALGWDSYFVKDYVKSNSTEKGSIASSPEEVVEIVKLIEKYRGEIEGGIAVRRVEKYMDNTEVRYFVMGGKAYSPSGEIPDIVKSITELIKAPFYSVDIIQRADGEYRVVEIGDGQVSDKKTWSTIDFSNMVAENA